MADRHTASGVQELPLDLPLPPGMSGSIPANASPKPEAPVEKDRPLSELEIALKREPTNLALMRQLGKKLQAAGRAREGEKLLLRALDLDPQNIESHFAIADFYQVQGLKFKAFKHLNVILQIQPDNEKAMEQLGVKKRKKGLYEISGRE